MINIIRTCWEFGHAIQLLWRRICILFTFSSHSQYTYYLNGLESFEYGGHYWTGYLWAGFIEISHGVVVLFVIFFFEFWQMNRFWTRTRLAVVCRFYDSFKYRYKYTQFGLRIAKRPIWRVYCLLRVWFVDGGFAFFSHDIHKYISICGRVLVAPSWLNRAKSRT